MQTESGPDPDNSLGYGPWQLNRSWHPAVLFLDIIVTGLGLCSVLLIFPSDHPESSSSYQGGRINTFSSCTR